jgi:hypothetical protein
MWFWLSHEEKCPCLELSMGGQPWPELELHSQPWGSSPEREGEGEGEGGGVGGAAVRPARVLLLHAVRERKTGRRREEKREKRKEEGKERKEKEKNGNIF